MHDTDEEAFVSSFSAVKMHVLFSTEKNIESSVISPKSINEVMLILKHGARGKTKDQIDQVFRCKPISNGKPGPPNSQATKVRNAARSMVRFNILSQWTSCYFDKHCSMI